MATPGHESTRDFWRVARAARQQLMQTLDKQALRERFAALASVISGKQEPQSIYENVWRSIGYNAVLTNLGRFPKMPKVQRFRVTAVYPVQSPDVEPVISVATTDERTSIVISAEAGTCSALCPSLFALLRRNTGWSEEAPTAAAISNANW
jgi:hypothetical protein